MSKVLSVLKYALPTLLCALFVIFNVVPFSLNPYYRMPIPFVLSIIFYYAVFHPAVLNVICVFVIGVFADTLMSTPFGFQTFFYVLIFFIANLNRRYFLTLNFADFWMSYALVCGGILLLMYLFFMMISLTVVPFIPMVFQYSVLVLTYPVMAWVCGWLNLKIGRA
jgi:rod shape-determining protein MreD